MKLLLALALVLALVLALPVAGNGEPSVEETARLLDPHQLFTEANRLFNAARSQEELRRAVENYRALLARGIRNGRIYYNLGNAHLRLRELGPAILNLRRALRYLPQDPYAAATLDYARKQVPDEFPPQSGGRVLGALFFWHHQVSLSARLWTALMAHAFFWALLLARAFFRLPFHHTALGALLTVALAAFSSAAVETLSQRGEEGVIVVPQAQVRSGNGEGFDPVFSEPVHSGVEVRILESRGAWKLLEFPNGVRGWLRESAVESVAGEAL